MFDDSKPLNAAQFRDIRNMGNTQPGMAFSQYIENEIEGYVNTMLRTDVTNVADLAFAQAGADVAKKFHTLLNGDIRLILEEHNVEPEEDYEAG